MFAHRALPTLRSAAAFTTKRGLATTVAETKSASLRVRAEFAVSSALTHTTEIPFWQRLTRYPRRSLSALRSRSRRPRVVRLRSHEASSQDWL
jgi:hypothetical protein